MTTAAGAATEPATARGLATAMGAAKSVGTATPVGEATSGGTAAVAVPEPRLTGQSLTLRYGQREIVKDLSVDIPTGRITVIVGANACGKSTLLRGLARLLSPAAGTVCLDGKDIHSLPTKAVAAKLGILPQSPAAPDGIRVVDLVARGRYPHQGWFRQLGAEDDE